MSRDQCKEEEWGQFRKREVLEKKQFNLETRRKRKRKVREVRVYDLFIRRTDMVSRVQIGG